MFIIQTKQLTKKYTQGEKAIHAVNDVNLSVDKGEMTAIIGTSGSGKTTLLNLIGGIDKPSKGTILIDDTDICGINDSELAKIRRRKIGFIFQNFNLIPILSAKENIIMPSLLDGKKIDMQYFNEIIDLLNIKDRMKHLPSELSGGQKQRVAIARALINRPSIILADEPTGNLDRKTADDIMQLFVKINKMGNTILLVTHDEKYAELCSRKITIVDGTVS